LNNRDRLDTFLRRNKRNSYCASDIATIIDSLAETDHRLFKHLLDNKQHVLYPLLPDEMDISYNLLYHHHNRQLMRKSMHLI